METTKNWRGKVVCRRKGAFAFFCPALMQNGIFELPHWAINYFAWRASQLRFCFLLFWLAKKLGYAKGKLTPFKQTSPKWQPVKICCKMESVKTRREPTWRHEAKHLLMQIVLDRPSRYCVPAFLLRQTWLDWIGQSTSRSTYCSMETKPT